MSLYLDSRCPLKNISSIPAGVDIQLTNILRTQEDGRRERTQHHIFKHAEQPAQTGVRQVSQQTEASLNTPGKHDCLWEQKENGEGGKGWDFFMKGREDKASSPVGFQC